MRDRDSHIVQASFPRGGFDLHRAQNTILVVVTHSAELAARLPIRFTLLDAGLRRS